MPDDIIPEACFADIIQVVFYHFGVPDNNGLANTFTAQLFQYDQAEAAFEGQRNGGKKDIITKKVILIRAVLNKRSQNKAE